MNVALHSTAEEIKKEASSREDSAAVQLVGLKRRKTRKRYYKKHSLIARAGAHRDLKKQKMKKKKKE